jgi:hypothetical protein
MTPPEDAGVHRQDRAREQEPLRVAAAGRDHEAHEFDGNGKGVLIPSPRD